MTDLRIGLGYDVHTFIEGRPLILGGVQIDNDRGLLGHSDADVVTHALMDAILSAMRAGDIGEHFPDTDPAYENARSVELLERVAQLMTDQGYRIVDADLVLACERPKIAPYRARIRNGLAVACGVEVGRVGLKATTTEGLGFTGRGEGAAAWAVVLLEQI